MSLSRRSFLSTSLAAGIGSAVPACYSDKIPESGLRVHTVTDDSLQPLFSAGDMLLVDITIKNFQQPGFYLYPAWGQPKPWLVREEFAKNSSSLGFFHPVTDVRMWRNSLAADHQFAGKVLSRLSTVQAQASQHSVLMAEELAVIS